MRPARPCARSVEKLVQQRDCGPRNGTLGAVNDGVEATRVSTRLLFFVFDLLRERGVDPRAVTGDLASWAGREEPPEWVTWSDYITVIDRLAEVAGGHEGIARAMRATLATAYSELRALAGFFQGVVPFLSFVTHHLMAELVPCARGRVEVIDERRVRIRYEIAEGAVGSTLYFQGTVTLLEVFPTHVGLPEARVEVVSMTDRDCVLDVELPEAKAPVVWAAHASPTPSSADSLTLREQEVLRHVCEGDTNAEIATKLGTSTSTVRNQISSILTKMDAVNRTELAGRVSRGA